MLIASSGECYRLVESVAKLAECDVDNVLNYIGNYGSEVGIVRLDERLFGNEQWRSLVISRLLAQASMAPEFFPSDWSLLRRLGVYELASEGYVFIDFFNTHVHLHDAQIVEDFRKEVPAVEMGIIQYLLRLHHEYEGSLLSVFCSWIAERLVVRMPNNDDVSHVIDRLELTLRGQIPVQVAVVVSKIACGIAITDNSGFRP
jgi:hypothetical protein